MNRTSRTDVWVWVCVAAAVLFLRLYPAFSPELGHDSFQYLSAADNAKAGRIGYTSLIHFDVERSFGVLPAPMLTFPSGFPVAIALVSLIGVSTRTAAMMLSVLATLGSVALLCRVGRQLGLSRATRHVILACFALNGIVSEFGAAALSEAVFTFLALLGVAALANGRLRAPDGRLVDWIVAGLAFGAAYFVRYAGLFFIVGLALLIGRHLWSRDRPLALGHAIALAVAGLFVLGGIARNMMLVGNWRGRDEMLVSNPMKAVLVETMGAFNGLLLGVGTGSSAPGGTFVPKALFAVLLVIGLAALGWLRWRARAITLEPAAAADGMAWDLIVLAGTYTACMMYAGHVSSISFGAARNFLPALPLYLLLFGMLLRVLLPAGEPRGTAQRWAIGALAISLCCYAYLNLFVIRKPLADQVAVVQQELAASPGGADGFRASVARLAGPDGAILANDGQAVGYFLGRRTISMVGPIFSNTVWDEATVHATVQQFHIAAVIITAPIPGRPDDSDIPSPFIDQLAQGVAPSWLKLVDHSGLVLTYVPIAPNS